eukprot:7131378-Prymnesium_polylepis.1
MRKLSDLTIHTVTAHLTSTITKGKVPNCVKNWEQDVGPNVPFDKVFASTCMGTPLSLPRSGSGASSYTER